MPRSTRSGLPIRAAITAAALSGAAALSVIAAPTATAAPPMPSGYYAGTVTSFPPGNLAWRGKAFTGNRVVNDTAIGWAFPGAAYPGRSVIDGREIIVVDYSGGPLGFTRDEMWSDGRGGYWGSTIIGRSEVLRFHLRR